MTCPKEAELALYVGGEAARRRIQRIEHHVRACPRCARKVAEFQWIRSAVATSGSQMASSAREQVRAEIAALISREPAGLVGTHPLLPIIPIACVVIALLASAGLVRTLLIPQAAELQVALPSQAQDPPSHAFLFSAPRARQGAESPEPVQAQVESRGTLESARLEFVQTSDGLVNLAQLRIPTKDPSLEIHWIME